MDMIAVMDFWSLFFIVLFPFFIAGYFIGRRRGLREGVAHGRLLAPLELRRENCLKGTCQLCGAGPAGAGALSAGPPAVEVSSVGAAAEPAPPSHSAEQKQQPEGSSSSDSPPQLHGAEFDAV
ncbi:MAG TPA: hypothetical protein GXX29_02290 [Firmicutes bacterium]|nr:hypothetical protein [Bacillota bacterium]